MRRKLAGLLLVGFLVYTGVYIFVYLARAFRVDHPRPLEHVGIYHGDEFARTLLVAVLFLIGEIFLVYLALAMRHPRRVTLRADLWTWLRGRSDLTGEPLDHIAERAVSQYRARLEGGPGMPLPSTEVSSGTTATPPR
jgi:hypothetical protein